MDIKIFANYGVLAAEKRIVYTYGNPQPTAVTWDEITVEIPDGWDYYESEWGFGIVTAPWGQNYEINQILGGDKSPVFSALDKNGKGHRVKLKVKPNEVI